MRTRKRRVWALTGMILTAAVVGSVIAASSPAGKPEITVKSVPAQTVLYTIHRGSYDQFGPAIGKLFGLAGQKQLQPLGPPTMTYLNNPHRTTPAHYLTEIRIPVPNTVLPQAGTFGPFTDVKTIPAHQVAAAIKPVGMSDPAPVYTALHRWIYQNGYHVVDGSTETCLTPATAGDYANMKCSIAIPVEKLTVPKAGK